MVVELQGCCTFRLDTQHRTRYMAFAHGLQEVEQHQG